MENTYQETYYEMYHEYSIKHPVNRNLDILPIQHIAFRKVKNPTTKNRDFQFQLAFIYYLHLHIHQLIGDYIFVIHKDDFRPKTLSNIYKCLKCSIWKTLSVIMLYKDGVLMIIRFKYPISHKQL